MYLMNDCCLVTAYSGNNNDKYLWLFNVLLTRRYASITCVLAVSVCLSHSGVVLKWLQLWF